MSDVLLEWLSGYFPYIAGVVVSGCAAAAMWYLLTRPEKSSRIKPAIDLQNQTVQLSNAEHDRMNVMVADAVFKKSPFGEVFTVYDAFRRGRRMSDDGPCFGVRKGEAYEWMSYNEVIDHAQCLAAMLTEMGLLADQTCKIGIFAKNCREWAILEQACHINARIIVPLYDTFGMEAVEYIMRLCEIRFVLCDTNEKALSLLGSPGLTATKLKHLVIVEEPSDVVQHMAKKHGVSVMSYEAALALGRKKVNEIGVYETPPLPSDVCTICFTSGTTGTPKGVVLTHASVMAATTAVSVFKNTNIDHTDSFISYLPLAHSFERMLETVIVAIGGRIGFYSGDVRKLTDDMRVLKPTIVIVVPRLLNRAYDKVMSEANKSVIKKTLFDMAIRFKMEEVRDAAMGCVVVEGYGQTETSGCASVVMEGDCMPGHVGPPLTCCKIKLVDVPEMDYFSGDDKGEILIKGYNIFKEYYKDPEKTKEAIDEDGWLHTGDIGRWTERGTLQIIDRRKNIFKLAQGEYIAPERIENVYVQSPYVAQAYVYGDSFKSCLIAVVIPEEDELHKLANAEGIKDSTAELYRNEKLKKAILDDMVKNGKAAELKTFEQVKRIHLDDTPWSVENDLLTPTFKLKRPAIEKKYSDVLKALYEGLD